MIIKKRIKLVAIVLMSLILFQSCRVYHRESVTLEKAVEEGKRVKIKIKDSKTQKFKKIVLDNSKYYGVKKIRGKMVLIPINISDTKIVRLHNKTLSIIYGTGIGLVVAVFVIVVAAIATWKGPDIPVDIQF